MRTVKQVLESLDPPIKYKMHAFEGEISLRFMDDSVPASVERILSKHELEDPVQFRIIVLYAVNELRGKGSHAPLVRLPDWE